jgi:CDGSH-type Zn-finger protein
VDDRAKRMRITVTEDGPYRVSGGVPLVRVEIVTNEAGESIAWRETERIEASGTYSLCRCGHSEDKPFCDASHVAVGFDGTETAARDGYFEIAANIDGPGVRLHDARKLCAEARFCDRAGGLWNLVTRCDDDETRALAEEEAMLCPSGRYVICDSATGEVREPEFEPSIAIVEDPSLQVSGPLWVRGGIPIFSEDGTPYEVRNRVTLCRCGHSANKPYCDGSHLAHKFTDAE